MVVLYIHKPVFNFSKNSTQKFIPVCSLAEFTAHISQKQETSACSTTHLCLSKYDAYNLPSAGYGEDWE